MTARDPFSLDGRVALVTGSSRGIGRALARALGAAGAVVVLNARGEATLSTAAEELAGEGLTVHPHGCDVTDPDAVEAMVVAVEAEVGPLDILVNNAGAQERAPFLEFPLEGLQRVLDVNLVAPFVVAQAVGKRMAERGRGKIVNVCSVMSQLGRAGVAPYAASKGGLKLLTQALCAELGPLGVQVNAVAPGYFATELTQALVDDAEFSAWVASRTPAGRWGRLDELGGAAVFLASDASSYVNGHILYVDGGMTAVV